MSQSAATPKAELHAHLNGCVPFDAVARLAEMPMTRDEYVIRKPVASLAAYFAPWTISRYLANSATKTAELVGAVAAAFAADAVTYAELRNSVRHLADLNGITWTDSIGWLLDAFDAAAEDSGLDLRLIVTLTREHFTLDGALSMLDAMREHAGHARLVGIDLAGDESLRIPLEASRVFRQAKDELGLGVTIHAGEIPGTAENVMWAIEECNADRVGHALASASDDRVMNALIETDTCVEVCITSNLMTSSVEQLTEHPGKRLCSQCRPDGNLQRQSRRSRTSVVP
jgi:adenosine deaminase